MLKKIFRFTPDFRISSFYFHLLQPQCLTSHLRNQGPMLLYNDTRRSNLKNVIAGILQGWNIKILEKSLCKKL